MNLVALTACCVDYYPQLQRSHMGGNSLNVASMWKKRCPRAQVSVITCLGNDPNGEMISSYLSRAGIDCSRVYVNEGSTACNQLRVDDHGERFGIEGTWNGGLYETFHLSGDDWNWVAQQDIVAMPANNPNFDEMLKRKLTKQVLSVDYLDVENRIPVKDTIDSVDIAFVTGRVEDLGTFERLAREKNKLVVVTLGAGGSYAFHRGKVHHQPALPVPRVIDTTGCGDAYQAAFALDFCLTGDVPSAMLAGAQSASLILQAWGGVGNIDLCLVS